MPLFKIIQLNLDDQFYWLTIQKYKCKLLTLLEIAYSGFDNVFILDLMMCLFWI